MPHVCRQSHLSIGDALSALAFAGLMASGATAQTVNGPSQPPDSSLKAPMQAPAQPPVVVIGTSPLPGVGIDRDKLPSNAQTLRAPDIASQGPAALVSGLDQRIGSVNISDNEDNPYQPDIQYRGLTASPVLGTPTGLAVYQNGVRLNEPFGDNVAWDLVPDFAIDRISLIPTNPVYGLNALGGALVLELKTGFNYEGGEVEAEMGSFGQREWTAQYGRRSGDTAVYVGANAADETGYRKLSPSRIRQFYADIGVEDRQGRLHLSLTAADNRVDGIGPTPIQLVDVDRTAVFVSPQTFHDRLLMPALTGQYLASDTLSFQGNLYVRDSERSSFAGNITDVIACDASIPDTLCLGDPETVLFDTHGRPVPNVLGGLPPAENDASSTRALGLGASLQLTSTAALGGHANHLVAGVSDDHGAVDFVSTNEVATIDPVSLVTQGSGIIIQQPDGSLDPAHLATADNAFGLFASDTLSLTSRLALTAGGRYNVALVRLRDRIGTALNGNSRFSGFNPAAGAAYRINAGLTVYLGMAKANRTPTAGEIGCSDPARPCTLDAFLSADPPGLRQVIAHNTEAGLRGRFGGDAPGSSGRVEWNLGVFRTELGDDILTVPSSIVSSGYFQNIGSTRRQGVEAGISYKIPGAQFALNYSLVDARFQSPITLSSPANPAADADGNIQVRPGDRLPGVPERRLKIDAEDAVSDSLTIGGDLVAVGNQVYFNDASNANPPLAGHVVVNLRGSYRASERVEVFALVKNLLRQQYATYGIYNDPTRSPLPGVANPSDPRFVSVAPLMAAYAGVRVRF